MNVKKTAVKIFRTFFPKKTKKNYGLKDEVREWAVSFVVAAVVYFVVLPAILGSSSPMVIVSSCSEKGYYNIGDILVIQGTNITNVKAPLAEISSFSEVSPVIENNKISAINVNGRIISANDSNDVVVYYATPSGAQIIHRAMALLKRGGDYYLMTKGDANPIPDQYGVYNNTVMTCVDDNPGVCLSTLITQKKLVGKKTLVQVPLLGHVKLFFCDVLPLCEGHSNMGTNYEYKLTC
ncbi:hypothetical protein H0N95_01210 [Candidatus Micrarchaeota archaeon]|nr:hypothetical protein [Candidatus Micrarchaeota archaeon]